MQHALNTISLSILILKPQKNLRNVDKLEMLPGTPFSENPSQPPNFAPFCGQRGIPTWYLYSPGRQHLLKDMPKA
jgi:hypothetical protein